MVQMGCINSYLSNAITPTTTTSPNSHNPSNITTSTETSPKSFSSASSCNEQCRSSSTFTHSSGKRTRSKSSRSNAGCMHRPKHSDLLHSLTKIAQTTTKTPKPVRSVVTSSDVGQSIVCHDAVVEYRSSDVSHNRSTDGQTVRTVTNIDSELHSVHNVHHRRQLSTTAMYSRQPSTESASDWTRSRDSVFSYPLSLSIDTFSQYIDEPGLNSKWTSSVSVHYSHPSTNMAQPSDSQQIGPISTKCSRRQSESVLLSTKTAQKRPRLSIAKQPPSRTVKTAPFVKRPLIATCASVDPLWPTTEHKPNFTCSLIPSDPIPNLAPPPSSHPSTGSMHRTNTIETVDSEHNSSRSKRLKSIVSKQSISSVWTNRFESLLRHSSFLQSSSVLGAGLASAVTTNPPGLIQEINDHKNGVNCLELSEDRSLLVSGGEDGVLRLWSTFSTPCECIGVLVGHTDYITCCTIYRYLVISGSADTTLKLWKIEDGSCLVTLKGHTAFINRCVCYGALLLSTSFDNSVRIWSLTDCLTMVRHVKSSDTSGDDHDFDSIDDLESLDQDTVDPHWNHQSNETVPSTPMFKTKRLPSELITRQRLQTHFGACLYVLEGHTKSVTQVAIVNSESTTTSQLDNGVIQELDLVVTTSTDGTARTYNLASGELRHVLEGHQGPINCLAMDNKERQFVYTAGADRIIKCWDVITGEHLRDLKGHQDAILCLLSHNRILYSGSADNTVRAWAMEFGQCTRIYYRNTSSITCMQYFKGILYTGSNDNSARLYDSNSAVLKQTFNGHTNSISAIKVVPGKLFTASFDSRILVWDCRELQDEIEHSGSASHPLSKSELTRVLQSKSDPSNHSGRYRAVSHLVIDPSALQIDHYTGKSKPPTTKRNANKVYPFGTQSAPPTTNHFANDLDEQVSNQLHLLYDQLCRDRHRRSSSKWLGGEVLQQSAKWMWATWFHRSTARNDVRGKNINLGRRSGGHDGNRSVVRHRTMPLSSHRSKSPLQPGGGESCIEEDSANVRRAITALEPYLRSFQ